MLAIVFSGVNIVGGLAASQCMLDLFKKQGQKELLATFLISGLLLIAALCWDGTLSDRTAASPGWLCVVAVTGLASAVRLTPVANSASVV